MLNNKKAQIGETMTWVIATIIIVVIMSIFIYTSTLLAKTKSVNLPDIKIGEKKETDLIPMKISFAYEKTPLEKREIIDKWLEKQNEK